MADPTMQTFCCILSNETREGSAVARHFDLHSYNIVCIVSSLLGIAGAIYQVLPREKPSPGRQRTSYIITRGRQLIIWLAVADLFASAAVLIRAVYWLDHKNLINKNNSYGKLMCAILSGLIQYFYTATWMWTLCYAIDVQLVLKDKTGLPKLYHGISWGLPAVLCLSGLGILYYPDFNCSHLGSSAIARILPNYVVTFMPIMLVMVVNPILYTSTSKKVEKLLVERVSRYTSQEHELVSALQLKFLCINVTYYMCWLPNIVSGVVLWTMFSNLPHNFILSMWYLMAVFNPLQALLNCLVYQQWGKDAPKVQLPWNNLLCLSQTPLVLEQEGTNSCEESLTENSPLLQSGQMNFNQGRHSINGFQRYS